MTYFIVAIIALLILTGVIRLKMELDDALDRDARNALYIYDLQKDAEALQNEVKSLREAAEAANRRLKAAEEAIENGVMSQEELADFEKKWQTGLEGIMGYSVAQAETGGGLVGR